MTELIRLIRAICLYDLKNRLLVTDDVICGERKDIIRMDKEIYISSLKKLLKLEVNQLIMGHPFKPMGKPVLTGDEPRRMIETSIDIAEKM
ncbi:MAG: fold metallo-hydrolase [Thermoproteota archaeon]|nr:fold metallo-hydrolase [Thermoproteota archaeon]